MSCCGNSSTCFIQYIQTQFQSNFQRDLHFWMFPPGDMNHGHLWREVSKIVCSSITFSLKVTGPCTHLKEGYLLLHFYDYLLSCVFAAICQVLRGGSHKLQTNQPKTGIFFASAGDFSPESSALPSEPLHLAKMINYLIKYLNLT